MLTDSQELELTTDSLEAVNAINGFFGQFYHIRLNTYNNVCSQTFVALKRNYEPIFYL
ncbi:MAG: hypothetical protein PUP92_30975 [Rhizonema sp. PD38]|nr:hypothetical protein [Rhizonema sp. PD38]